MKKIIVFIIVCINLNQVSANTLLKKETLFNKVSFLFQKKDSSYSKEFSVIEKSFKEEDYVNSLEKALLFYDRSKEAKSSFWSYKVVLLIGDIYGKTNNVKKSLEYYQKSRELSKTAILDEKNSNFSDANFATPYLKIGSSYQKLSLADNNNNNNKFFADSAKYYYKKVENLPLLNTKIEKIKARAYNNLSGIYQRDSLFEEAEYYNKKAIRIHTKYNNNIGVAIGTNNLGNISLSQKKYKKAKEFYLEGIGIIKNDNSLKATSVKQGLYGNLSWVMRHLKEYEAFDVQEIYYNLQDTIREKEFRGIVEQITHEYDFEATKKRLEKEQELLILKERGKMSTLTLLGVFLLITLVVVIGYYSFRQKNLQLRLSQTELLQNQNLDKLKLETQARVLDATLNGRELERKEIAETLHDSVSAMLSSANLHLQATRRKFDNEVPIEILKTQEIIMAASQNIRDLSHNLVSSVLLKFGLNFAVRDIAEKYSNSELRVDAEIEGLRRYHQNFEIKAYNIIHEFVNNILKHSKAKTASIKIKEEQGQLLVQICDDGIGFNQTKVDLKDGLGINQIDARIQTMKGKIKITSKKGKGTQIKVELPIQEKEVVNLF
jgi:two-component system NarL family sensor kinase